MAPKDRHPEQASDSEVQIQDPWIDIEGDSNGGCLAEIPTRTVASSSNTDVSAMDPE
jgi:hypothetical protein